MDGVHDLGGRHGIGAVRPEVDEPVFHSDWERKVLTMFPAMALAGVFNLDQFRAAMERIPAAEYLTTRYYEHWMHAIIEHGVRAGIFDSEDLERRTRHYLENPQEDPPETTKPELVESLRQLISNGDVYRREVETLPVFAVGDTVRVKLESSTTHTRRAGYVRGKSGEIIAAHGAYIYPDTHATGEGECPEHVYTVRFTGKVLWGAEPNAANTIVHIDLWEPYLIAACSSSHTTEQQLQK